MPHTSQIPERAGIRVLLVDDSDAFLRVASEFLDLQGHLVVVGAALGAEQGLALAQELRPQIVLLDPEMLRPTGLETIARLRKVLPEAGIIALSLFDDIFHRQAALEAGADSFVPKLGVVRQLIPAIEQIVQSRQLGQTQPALGSPCSKT